MFAPIYSRSGFGNIRLQLQCTRTNQFAGFIAQICPLHPMCAYTQTGIRSLGSRIVAGKIRSLLRPFLSTDVTIVPRKCTAVSWLRSTEVIYARHWVVSVQYSGTCEPLKRQSHHSLSSTRIIYATFLSFLILQDMVVQTHISRNPHPHNLQWYILF